MIKWVSYKRRSTIFMRHLHAHAHSQPNILPSWQVSGTTKHSFITVIWDDICLILVNLASSLKIWTYLCIKFMYSSLRKVHGLVSFSSNQVEKYGMGSCQVIWCGIFCIYQALPHCTDHSYIKYMLNLPMNVYSEVCSVWIKALRGGNAGEGQFYLLLPRQAPLCLGLSLFQLSSTASNIPPTLVSSMPWTDSIYESSRA